MMLIVVSAFMSPATARKSTTLHHYLVKVVPNAVRKCGAEIKK